MSIQLLGNGVGLIHFVVGSTIDSFPNNEENVRMLKVRLAKYRTLHQREKLTSGSSQNSPIRGAEVHVEADASAVVGTLGGSAVDITRRLANDNRNSLTAASIDGGILTYARERPMAVVVISGEAGDDTLTNIAPASGSAFIDGDRLILANVNSPAQALTISEAGDSADGPRISLRDSGAPIMRNNDILELIYQEGTSGPGLWREITRNIGQLKALQKVALLAGGQTVSVTSTAEFINLVISGGGATLTGDNTITLPTDSRSVVNILIDSVATYGGGELIIGGVTVPQHIIETGRAYGVAFYNTLDEEWLIFWLPSTQRSDMGSNNVSQAFNDLVGSSPALGATAGAQVSANTAKARRTQPLNPQAYALVELAGTITVNASLTHANTYNLFTGLPEWMQPNDNSPVGRVVPVERSAAKGAVLTYIEVDSSGNLICRPISGSDLQTGDIIHLDRITYQSDDTT